MKYREMKIKIGDAKGSSIPIQFVEAHNTTFTAWEEIHVIEFSAYTDALKMLEEMAGALDDYADARCKADVDAILDKYKQWKAGE